MAALGGCSSLYMADSKCSLSSNVVMWRVSRVSVSTAAMSAPHSFASESHQ